jgi:hypothetical protein
MIPASAEVRWLLAEGPYTYWRAEPADIHYEFAPGR